jgi:hypothetical protein
MVPGTVAMAPKTVHVPGPKPSAPKPPPPQEAFEPAQESGGLPWFVPLAIVGVLAVGIIGIAGWWRHQQTVQREQQAEQEAAAAKAQEAKVRAKPKPSPSAAPAAPAASASGLSVLVRSNVDGAAITVDGKTDPSWLTPHQIKLELGSHRVEVSKEGYRTSKTIMNLTEEGPGEVNMRLNPIGAPASSPTPKAAAPEKAAKPEPAPSTVGEGRLRIRTFPPNAEIDIDGAGTNYRTPVNMLLQAGKHKITVKHKNTADYSKQVVVVANEMVEMDINLEDPTKPIPANPQGKRRFFPLPRL